MTRRKRKLKVGRILILLLVVALLIIGVFIVFNKSGNKDDKLYMIELKTLEEANTFADNNDVDLNVSYEYNDEIEKDGIIFQSIEKGMSL